MRQGTTKASSRPGIASVGFCIGWLPRSAHARRSASALAALSGSARAPPIKGVRADPAPWGRLRSAWFLARIIA